MKRILSQILLSVALGVCLTGCGYGADGVPGLISSAPSSATDAWTPSSNPSDQGNGVIPQAQRSTELSPAPPLVAYAAYVDGPQITSGEAEVLNQWYAQQEDAVSECMQRKGFRYIPQRMDYAEGQISSLGWLAVIPVPFLSGDRAVVEKNGYGLMAFPEDENDQADVNDPNGDYLASLSAAEVDAYSIALNGDYTVPTTEGSCSSEALDRYPKPTDYSDRTGDFQAVYGDLILTMRSVVSRNFLSDQNVAALNGVWESCMNVAGYSFDQANAGTGPLAGMGLAVVMRPDGTVGESNAGKAVSEVPPEELSLVASEAEIAVALADYDCRVETNYMERITKIRFAMDEAFIAEHQAELDRLVAMADSW